MPAQKSTSDASGSSGRSVQNGTSMKMGSLSSFQATLNFTSLPISSTSTSSKSSKTAKEDTKRMPPPPIRTTGIKKEASSSSTNGGMTNGGAAGNWKGRKEDPIDLLDSDEDSAPVTAKSNTRSNAVNEMWADMYAPTMETELAPGKNRIVKVKNWIHEALYGYPPGYTPPGGPSRASVDKIRKYRRILLLTGPAGTGKTTSVKVIANEMGVDLVEWGEGVEEWSLGSGIDRESPMNKLSTFLARHSFAPLSLSSLPASSQPTTSRPRILLLASLPNVSHYPTRDAFHHALLEFCQNFSSASCPLIIVHSNAGSGGRAEESWIDRERGGREGAVEIVGKQVKDGPWCQEVDYISLAPTFITRALSRVLQSAISEANRRPPSSAVQLIAMTSNGDLRSAINSLQLLCARQLGGGTGRKRKKRDEEEGGSKKKRGKGSRGGKGAKLDVSEDLRAVLDAVTRREQSLNLFHALGKVFYNKRLDDPNIEDEDEELVEAVRALPETDSLPAHLEDFERQTSLVQMESFLPTIPIDASSFALWIHQSFPSFCTDIEQVSLAMDDFCRSDTMRTDEDFWQSSPQAIAYALHLTVRGSHMALPSPVPRNHQKLVKPQFFEAYRMERDNLAHLDTAAGHLAKKAVMASVNLSEKGSEVDAEGAWGGVSSKAVMVTELVPMMIKIQGLSKKPLLPSSVRPLALPGYHTAGQRQDELRSTDEVPIENEHDEDEGDVMPRGDGWEDGVDGDGLDMDQGAVSDQEDIEEWD